MVAWRAWLPCASSTCSPRPPAVATPSRSSTTRTTSPTRRWRRSPGGPTSPRRRSSAPRPTRAPTTACASGPPGASSLRGAPDAGQRARVAGGGRHPGIRGLRGAGVRCRPGRGAARRAAAVRRAPRSPAPVRSSGRDAARVVDGLGLDPADVVDLAWVDNGPGWVGVLLRSPDAVLAAVPDPGRCGGLKAGLVATYPPGQRDDGVAAEVRAFYSDGREIAEDPVTGSLNAGLAQWLVPAGHLPELRRRTGWRHRPRRTGPRRRRRRHRLGRWRDPHRRHRHPARLTAVAPGEGGAECSTNETRAGSLRTRPSSCTAWRRLVQTS